MNLTYYGDWLKCFTFRSGMRHLRISEDQKAAGEIHASKYCKLFEKLIKYNVLAADQT